MKDRAASANAPLWPLQPGAARPPGGHSGQAGPQAGQARARSQRYNTPHFYAVWWILIQILSVFRNVMFFFFNLFKEIFTSNAFLTFF